MQPDLLPHPEDLWWSWTVAAAGQAARGEDGIGLDTAEHVLRLATRDGSWVRMQRFRGGRAVLWGRWTDSSDDATTRSMDPLGGVPAWALSDAVIADADEIGFLAWWRRGEWDTSTPVDDPGSVRLLQSVLSSDPKAVRLARHGEPALTDYLPEGDHDAAMDLVGRARSCAEPATQRTIRTLLLDQIHQQMRQTREVGRMLTARPPVLVQWSRVHRLRLPFEYAVRTERVNLIPGLGVGRLPEPATASLHNVLRRLYAEEAGEESGAWLFARVTYDGATIAFDRAFDSWPGWFETVDDPGPGLPLLRWEMEQRSPEWRPAWASLLPA